MRRGVAADALEALGADAVRRLTHELLRDPRLPGADGLELEPLLADLEPPAPGAAEEHRSTAARFAQHLREHRDAGRVDGQRTGPLLRGEGPGNEILVQPLCRLLCGNYRSP